MSLIPHNFFPRRMIDIDSWMKPMNCNLCNSSSMMNPKFLGPTSLDMFDPFDELDTLMGRNIDWIRKPEFRSIQPLVQEKVIIFILIYFIQFIKHYYFYFYFKYRITVDCPGFESSRNNIKTDVKGNILIVTGHDEEKLRNGDYSSKEFRRTYELPEGAQSDKMVSFMPMPGVLIIEVLLNKEKNQFNMKNDLFSKIQDSNEGKNMSVTFGIPDNIDPSKINVNVKDRDLIIQADDTKTTYDGTSKFHFYKRTTLPADTDFDKIKVTWDQNKLICNAPMRESSRAIRSIPIDRKQIEVKNYPVKRQQIEVKHY